tara:strand:+ start:1151 stop:1267 length:117 start_codon:yes stop_codon:yes gene_type:complete
MAYAESLICSVVLALNNLPAFVKAIRTHVVPTMTLTGL